jgi:hypothetical protein
MTAVRSVRASTRDGVERLSGRPEPPVDLYAPLLRKHFEEARHGGLPTVAVEFDGVVRASDYHHLFARARADPADDQSSLRLVVKWYSTGPKTPTHCLSYRVSGHFQRGNCPTSGGC